MIFVDVYICKSKIKDSSKKIKECAETIDKILSELERGTTDLGNAWEGEDYQAFQKKIHQDYHDNINAFSKCLKEYADYLYNSSTAYQKLEDIFKDKEIEV